jgi:hypothetical protein
MLLQTRFECHGQNKRLNTPNAANQLRNDGLRSFCRRGSRRPAVLQR